MINLIIPSYKRPVQLYLLLESIEKYTNQFSVNVLYRPDGFEEGYNICKDRFRSSVLFYKETNFKQNLLESFFTHDNVSIACDDNIFFRKVDTIPKVNPGEVFSLRLGLNSKVQNYLNNEPLPPLNHYHLNEGIVSWNPRLDSVYRGYYNWEYPFSLDCHVYNSKQLYTLCSRIDFNSTNTLEGNLIKYRNDIIKMMCFEHSCSVNWPLNNLSGVTQSENVTVESLYEKFLNGEKISLTAIENSDIIGCHQSFSLMWESRR